ncbi:MAG: transposase [Thiotrichaceae bacterium]
MLLADKIELQPNEIQKEYLNKACGTVRHCYNQLLEHFSQKENPFSLKAAYDFYKNTLRPQFEWYQEISFHISANAIQDLNNAFSHFFRRLKLKQKPGFPKYKRKDIKESFSIRTPQKFGVFGTRLRIEKCGSYIRMRKPIRFRGQLKQVTISKIAGKYFASFLIDTEDYVQNYPNRQASVGVDFGIKALATLSNGEVYQNHRLLQKNLRKLKKLQRNFARKTEKDSNRRARAKLKIQKLHFRIARQRAAIAHQLSHDLTKTFDRIVLEDLNVKGMLKNRKLSRAIADVGFGMLRRFIEYKAKLRNCTLVIANRFFPSSKTCSQCGAVKSDLTLSDRIYSCDCGLVIDRDLNAAKVLNNYSC